MKTQLIFISLILFSLSSIAQDVITKQNGEEINSKIIEVNIDDIKYKKFDNLDGPVYSIKKSEVFMVKYENGSKDLFTNTENSKPIPVETKATPTSEDNFLKGKKDSERYYLNYKGAATGTLVTTLFVGIFGLIPAIACSTTPPKDFNLGYPNAELMKNTEYYNGYVSTAKRKKSNKVWANFGIGFGISIVALLIINSGGN